jgi:hypothetical protein
VADEKSKYLETVSPASVDALIRNAMDRIGEDETRAPNLDETVEAIAINTALLGERPTRVVRTSAAATTDFILIKATQGCRIVIFDMLVSLNAAANITFEDTNNTVVFPVFYAPNDGQGFVFNSMRGIWLPVSKGLQYTCSAAVAHSLFVSYSMVNSIAPAS